MINADPTGGMPAPDASGLIALRQTDQNNVLSKLVTFTILFWAAGSLLFWTATITNGEFPPNLPNFVTGYGLLGIFAIPFAPFVLLSLISPTRLEINDTGIRLTGMGRTKRMTWADMRGIELREVSNGGRIIVIRTKTIITGSAGSIRWMPRFGIAPRTLANYIRHRHQTATGRDLQLVAVPLARAHPDAEPKPFNGKIPLTGLIMIAVVSILALAGFFFLISAIMDGASG